MDKNAREKLMKRLQEEKYGHIPEKPEHLMVEKIYENRGFAQGEAVLSKLKFIMTVRGEESSFPVFSLIPSGGSACPALVYIAESEEEALGKLASEAVKNGYALFILPHSGIATDDADYRSGCAAALMPPRRKLSSPAKIALWAFGAMRVMDYIAALPKINGDRVTITGCGHLGEAALLAGGFDDRFNCVIFDGSAGELQLHRYCKRFAKGASGKEHLADLLYIQKRVKASIYHFFTEY